MADDRMRPRDYEGVSANTTVGPKTRWGYGPLERESTRNWRSSAPLTTAGSRSWIFRGNTGDFYLLVGMRERQAGTVKAGTTRGDTRAGAGEGRVSPPDASL